MIKNEIIIYIFTIIKYIQVSSTCDNYQNFYLIKNISLFCHYQSKFEKNNISKSKGKKDFNFIYFSLEF